MGPSPATVCLIMWVNQAQAWDDGCCTRPVLRISGAEEEILRVPRAGHAEKLPKGVIIPGIYIPHKGTSERMEALSLGDTGNEVIWVAGWEIFPEHFREDATQPFRLLGVGEKELEAEKYVAQSDIIVPVQRGSQFVMARCADGLVYLASVGPRAILGLPFFARYGLVILPEWGCFALVEDLCQGGPWDEFDYKCPPPEARTPLDMARSRRLEQDVHGMEHDKQPGKKGRRAQRVHSPPDPWGQNMAKQNATANSSLEDHTECGPVRAQAQGRQREEQAGPPQKKTEGGGGGGAKTAHSHQTARQHHQRRPNPPPSRHRRQDPQRSTGGPPSQNRQH